MGLKRNAFQSWADLSINFKFSIIFGMMLVVIILVALTGYMALSAARRQTEAVKKGRVSFILLGEGCVAGIETASYANAQKAKAVWR